MSLCRISDVICLIYRCHTDWKHFTEGREKKLALQFSAQDVLNINFTPTLIDLYSSTRVKWTEDYYKAQEDRYIPARSL